MADADSAENTAELAAAERQKTETQAEAAEPQEESSSPTWRTIRFTEIFFAVSCLSSLLALYITNPIYDDYTQFCRDLVKLFWSTEIKENYRTSTESGGFGYVGYGRAPTLVPSAESEAEATTAESTTNSNFPLSGKALFRLSYAIILFTFTATVLMVLVLDLASRLLGEPINKLPMIFMLAVSEVLCLIIMVFSLDMFLDAIGTMVAFSGFPAALAVSALALGLSICFATDLVYTSVRGNG